MRMLKIEFTAEETEKLLHGTKREREEIFDLFEQKLIQKYNTVSMDNTSMIVMKPSLVRNIKKIVSQILGGVKVGF